MTTRATLNGLRARLPLRIRADAVELLDAGGLSRRDVERNLADLARLNSLLPGGTAASITAIRRLTGDLHAAHIIDAGTGCADMPVAFARRGWRTTAVDPNPEVLRVARRTAAAEPSVEVVDGDVRSLPFGDAAFDVAHCSLLIHHLDPRDVIGAVRELARVSKRGIVINDLRRGPWPFVATVAGTALLARSHVTRRDGAASVRRAYTLDELDDLLARAGLAVRWRSHRWMPRVVTAATPS